MSECDHPPHLVVRHPTEPGKYYCRGCDRTGEIYTKGPGGVLTPKRPAIVVPNRKQRVQ